MISKIGFRIKFKDNNLEEMIREYSLLFKRYEVKITKSFYSEEYLKSFIILSRKYLKNNFSFHLEKNLFSDNESLEKTKKLFNVLGYMNFKGLLVTHMPEYIELSRCEFILECLSRNLPNGCILLLENVVCDDNMEYLKKIDELFEMISKKKITNVKICLDFGHLLFSFNKSGINQYDALDILKNSKNIINNIREIHLHDFNAQTDHLQLKKGIVDFSNLSVFLNKNKIKCPIILEVNVFKPENDGVQQINVVKCLMD